MVVVLILLKDSNGFQLYEFLNNVKSKITAKANLLDINKILLNIKAQ